MFAYAYKKLKLYVFPRNLPIEVYDSMSRIASNLLFYGYNICVPKLLH